MRGCSDELKSLVSLDIALEKFTWLPEALNHTIKSYESLGPKVKSSNFSNPLESLFRPFANAMN